MPHVGSHRVSTFNPGPEHHHPRSHPAASGLPAEGDRNQPQQTQQTQKEKVAKGCRQRVPSRAIASIWCRSNLENENPTANVVWLCMSCKIVDEWLRISEYLIYSCSCGDCILSGPQGLALSVRPLRHHHHPRKWYLSRNVPEHTASRARNPRKSAGSNRTKSHIFAKASHCHTGLRNWSEFAMQLGASCTHPAWHPISFLIKWDPMSSRKTPSRSSLLLATSQSQKTQVFQKKQPITGTHLGVSKNGGTYLNHPISYDFFFNEKNMVWGPGSASFRKPPWSLLSSAASSSVALPPSPPNSRQSNSRHHHNAQPGATPRGSPPAVMTGGAKLNETYDIASAV